MELINYRLKSINETMGSYLAVMPSGNELKPQCNLVGLSLAKIRELHGGFKSVCDNFAINLTQFQQIFQSNQQNFNLFDTDNNGLIDALEIFSGLIMFSDAKADDKIRFLFDLFDFNEIQTVSLLDLEFMIQSVLVSTSKIFNLGQDSSDLEIVQLVRRNFQEGSRLNVPQLLVWCSRTEEIQQFFLKFRMDGPAMIAQKTLQEAEFIIYSKHEGGQVGLDYQFPPGSAGLGAPDTKQMFISKSAAELVSNRRAQNFRQWLHTALQPLVAYRLDQVTMNDYLKVPDEMKARLEWVYGIRGHDTKRGLQYTVGHQYAESTGTRNKYEKKMQEYNEEIIYFVSSNVILLNVHLNRQRFYTEHTQEIISLAISNLNGDYIATGEFSSQLPSIHIWNCRTLQNINVLRGVHQRGIHLLAFSSDDKYLVSCGLQNPSAVVIYDWAIGQVIVSASVPSPTQDIVVLAGSRKQIETKKAVEMDLPESEQAERERLKAAQQANDDAQKLLEGFVIMSLDNLVVFVFDKATNEFKMKFLSLEQASHDTASLPLCAISLLADYRNQYFKQGNVKEKVGGKGQLGATEDDEISDIDHSLKHLVLTGHKDGKILIWRLQNYIGVLDDYQVEVTAMSPCYEGLAFATISGLIFIWDSYLLKCHRKVDINQFPFKILSSFIVSLDYNQRRLLLLTMNGDVVEMVLNDASSSQTIKAERVNSVVRLTCRTNKALAILTQSEQTIMVGGDNGIVSSYDISTHELIDIWNVGQPVTSLACLSLNEGGFVVTAGCETGNIIIRQDWEELISRQHDSRNHECGQNPIIDIKFSKNGQMIAGASLDKCIYLLKYHDGDYQALAACKVENGFPVSINFSEDSSKIVINTNQRKLMLLDPVTFEFMYKPDDLSTCFWSHWVSKYPLITKSPKSIMMPMVLGNQSNMVAAGDEYGNVFVWRDVESIKDHIGCNFLSHTSNVERLELTADDKRLISMGQSDHCICQFKLKPLHHQEQQVNLKRGVAEVQAAIGLHKIVLHPVADETLILELNYCYQIIHRKTDQIQDQTVLVRGSSNANVNRILAKPNYDNEEKVWQRPPAISLILENIYGVLTSDKRHTICYMHFYNRVDQQVADRIRLKEQLTGTKALGLTEQEEKKLDFILPRVLGTDYQQLLANHRHIEYDPVHATCLKFLAYYTSRYGVIYDMNKKVQNFYQGHKLKVSALARHPRVRVVATGEVNFSPQIHVWDAQTMETLVVLQTAHKGGVLHLVFSGDGHKLVSIGMDRCFSIQVFLWKQGRSIAFRNTGFAPIFAIKFNPFDDNVFITCGYQHLCEWKIDGLHLTVVKHVSVYGRPGESNPLEKNILVDPETTEAPGNLGHVQQKNILMSMDFISYRLGHSVQSDLIIGNNFGDICTYCSSKYFVLNEQAHPRSPINVVKVTNTLSLDMRQVNVVTGGEDGLLKIWDASIQLKQVVDLKASPAVAIKDLKNIKSYGIQSIDVFPCDKQSVSSTAAIKVLTGLRSGDVIEVLLDLNRNFRDAEEIMESKAMDDDQKQQELEKLKYAREVDRQRYHVKFNSVFSGHSSLQLSHKQKKIITCLYPMFGILASVGNDETLMVWDIAKNVVLTSKNLGTQATCLDFSPDGKFLAVGLANGVFLLLDSKIEQLNFGTYLEEYSKPSLEVIMCPKDAKASIINLKFSYQGAFLAVSFNNEYKLVDMLDEAEEHDEENPLSAMTGGGKPTSAAGPDKQLDTGKRDPSFVLIYVNKLSEQNPGIQLTSKDPYVKFQQVQIPLNEFQSSSALSKHKLGVTKMDFSDNDRYVEMCSQIVDKDNNVQMDNQEDIFIVWDIREARIVQDFDNFKNTAWPDWSLCSAINARYANRAFNRETDDEEKKKFLLEQCKLTSVCRFSLLDNAVFGTIYGELFAFRFGALFLDKNRVLDFKFDKVPKRQMAISKAFDCLTSMIASINIFEDKRVFVTGNNDQCILQYRVEYEDQDWELDFNNFLPEIPDPFGEIPHYSKFMTLLNEIWAQRLELPEILQNMDQEEYKSPAAELELEFVIGRRAYDRRNNVKLDCRDRIIYIASSLIVFLQDNMDTESDSFITQTFLRPQDEKFTTTAPEVSCFALSDDRRILFVGLNQIESILVIWEISTNLQLDKITLPQMSMIYLIKVAYDNKHLVMTGVTNEFIATIVLYDWTTQTLICQKLLLHSLPYKIKDLCFLPGYTRRFVSCGVQHLTFWKFNGQSLEYTVGELTIPTAFSSIGQGVYSHDKNNVGKFGLNLVCEEAEMIAAVAKNKKQKAAGGTSVRAQFSQLDEELENIYTTFLALGFIDDTLITAGDDGFLYIWEHQRIIRRVFAHEGAIFALDCSQRLGFIASGGMEGVVILWRLLVEPRSNIKSLDKLKVFNLRRNLDAQHAVMNPEYNIQSVCLGYNRVIVGTRSGSVVEMQISDDGTRVIRQMQDKKSRVRKWMKCIDNEVPISVACDMVSKRIFTITEAGLFTVFDLMTFDVTFQKDFHKVAQNIIAFKLQNKVLLVFDNDIIVVDANVNSGGYDELKEYELKLTKITDAKLNTNEKLLGVASSASSVPEVSLFANEDGFAKLSVFYGFKASIEYIDFSTDNYYLQCQDILGDVQLFEIESSRPINTDAMDFDLEWLGEGLRSYSPLEEVHKQYNAGNKVLQIVKMPGKPIVAIGDELGTIRFYNHPKREGSEGYYQCYPDHLYSITKCMFTHDKKFFISVSSFDRCVFKWKVSFDDQYIRELMQKIIR